MIPRFRVWDVELKSMKEVMDIDYRLECVELSDSDGDTYIQGFSNIKLMQSTGLTDKNGKEIFEGDIISIETDEENVKVKIEVSWDSKHALFVFESKKYNEKEALGELFEDNPYPFKIIGNVWEDQELAEVRS